MYPRFLPSSLPPRTCRLEIRATGTHHANANASANYNADDINNDGNNLSNTNTIIKTTNIYY